MAEREVVCDFCNAVLVDSAWDCPAESFDYQEPRIDLSGTGPVIEGSLGSWMACDDCAALVRDGKRAELVDRAIDAALRETEAPPITDRMLLRAELRPLHDRFWKHRLGPPVKIGTEQLELIRSDPELVREER